MTPFYAILRYDGGHASGDGFDAIRDRISVKGIVVDLETAEAEVERLNRLNGGLGCHYWWTPARQWPPPWKTNDMEKEGTQS